MFGFRPYPCLLLGLMACAFSAYAEPSSGVIEEALVAPPAVPAPITRHTPTTVVVHLRTEEKVMDLADGVRYDFWTFNGSVPGPMIRVREGDTVELHLSNDAHSHMSHNIDLHAVMGPGGGAAMTVTNPGHESILTFKAMRPGLFVYHCATAPVPMHIANGMYGTILVEPAAGLPKVDREYYVMQGDFYTQGHYHDPGLQNFDTQKLLDEQPTYVLFNGRENALNGEHALYSKTGEHLRLFVGNGGPNLSSSFHIIGQIFDSVSSEGGSLLNHNVQTTLIPPGDASTIELTTLVPGTYLLVDHAITRAFMKGALAQLRVDGPARPDLYHGQNTKPATQPLPSAAHDPMAIGKRVFTQICSACHQGNAMGLPGAFPPLAMSDYLNSDPHRAISIVLHGLSGHITVNNTGYESQMPAFGPQLSDDEIAGVLTYVLNSFNNRGGSIDSAEVGKVRQSQP